jgi:hypothetical protein
MVEGEKIVGLIGLKKQGFVKIESEFSLLMHFLRMRSRRKDTIVTGDRFSDRNTNSDQQNRLPELNIRSLF